MKKVLCLLLMWVGVSMAAPVKLASLHPLLSDMAKRVGGEQVEVVDLFPVNAELHSFAPSGAELAAAVGCRAVLACGKGVEPYLKDLREALAGRAPVVELGAKVPDVRVPGSLAVDPHWWNAPQNMKRASLELLALLKEADADHAAEYEMRQRGYAQDMDKLVSRAKLALAGIPAKRRVLVCAHAAMCHFCESFRFTPIAAQGIAKESEGDMARMAALLAELRERQVRCVFVELRDSPKFLENIAAQVGARVGTLVMDGVSPEHADYEGMFMYNVESIRDGLTSDEPSQQSAL